MHLYDSRSEKYASACAASALALCSLRGRGVCVPLPLRCAWGLPANQAPLPLASGDSGAELCRHHLAEWLGLWLARHACKLCVPALPRPRTKRATGCLQNGSAS